MFKRLLMLNALFILLIQSIFGQTLQIHTANGTDTYNIADIDSITFEIETSQPQGLIVYYPFNGNANDESGNGNNGTIMGGATVNEFLTTGNNNVDALSIPNTVLDGITEFTLCANVKINTFHANHANFLITGTRSGQLSAFAIHFDPYNHYWVLNFNHNSTAFSVNSAMEDLNWHHLVILRSGTTARLYIDGSEVGNGITVPNDVIEIDANGLIVGQEQDAIGGGFQSFQSWSGNVDNLRIYNTALSVQEINSIYNADSKK